MSHGPAGVSNSPVSTSISSSSSSVRPLSFLDLLRLPRVLELLHLLDGFLSAGTLSRRRFYGFTLPGLIEDIALCELDTNRRPLRGSLIGKRGRGRAVIRQHLLIRPFQSGLDFVHLGGSASALDRRDSS